MVLAHAVDSYVPHKHQLVVVRLKGRDEVLAWVFGKPRENFRVHAGDPGRRFAEPLTSRVFAYRDEDFPDCGFDLAEIHSYVGCPL
jgi:hypothetical protein